MNYCIWLICRLDVPFHRTSHAPSHLAFLFLILGHVPELLSSSISIQPLRHCKTLGHFEKPVVTYHDHLVPLPRCVLR